MFTILVMISSPDSIRLEDPANAWYLALAELMVEVFLVAIVITVVNN